MVSLLLTVVLTNPYQGIDYNSINSYDIEYEYLEDVIHVTEAESGSSNYYEEDIKKEEDYSETREKEKNYQLELNRLYPYIFPSTLK